MRKKIVAGNWKMNTLPAEGVELAKQVAAGKHTVCDCVSFIVCPPFTHLSEVSKTLEGTGIAVGAQNCAAEAKGAYTGEVAASMIAALGCKYVILGHSERRQYYGETSETLNRKMEQAYANDLVPIYCVGENLDEREAGKHFDVVKAQIEEVVYNLTPEQFGKLGHRHGQDRDGRAGAGDPRLHPQGAGRQVRRSGRGVPDPLRRVVQTVQRSRDLRQRGRRRRSDRRRSAQSRRFSGHRQGLREVVPSPEYAKTGEYPRCGYSPVS